ncbi:mandelate racemase/muconate lactonizing enzyme family protein [Alicyclobacillus dauci]|uniref:Mandelate racemase/muconate lactonizing enzyme C-terminal domain-containing protein n=1 Tax=Alicyclobacillus dauci TaxID=1475485 RepID=A0ABY6YX69_9BACL|nr:enolase C-terminal domain-like protein [Alicyclobacillus dauci]WAH35183.1 hypothetical protein NZD86_12750 [Alicyclobacillus dauci]
MEIIEARIWPMQAVLHHPIRVSFGEMRKRPGFLLSLKDKSGLTGWGESWVNFPPWGPAERTMVLSYLLKEIVGQEIHPGDIPTLYARYLLQVIQWGGIGPYSQAVSAVECALWDLEAKRKSVPLYELLQPSNLDNVHRVSVYGSGIDPSNLEQRITDALSAGFQEVKIKIGFDSQQDRNHFKSAVKMVGDGNVMVDANQAWDRTTAGHELSFYTESGAGWIEEPISAYDTEGYRIITEKYDSVASGENWYVPTVPAVSSIKLRVLQPDLCKVGGVWAAKSMILHGPRTITGVAFHVLGLPVSHAFALHVAAAWKDVVTKVEIDTNENPLSDTMIGDWSIKNGQATLGARHGLGIEVDEEKLASFVLPELHRFCTVSAE